MYPDKYPETVRRQASRDKTSGGTNIRMDKTWEEQNVRRGDKTSRGTKCPGKNFPGTKHPGKKQPWGQNVLRDNKYGGKRSLWHSFSWPF